jgi:23S rRNA (pseudouridine1915-N3)-methyltransferase
MYIKVIAVGKLKNEYLELQKEFLKRLGSWNVELLEVEEVKLDSGYYNILLDADGKQMDSVEFSKFLVKKRDLDQQKVCLVIGGAMGFDDDFKKQFDMSLSFGKMTFTHQMVRILLLEQLYRAFAISVGKNYHY